jgi:hypothetical protein
MPRNRAALRMTVKCGVALLKTDVDTVGQQVVLPKKVLFVHEFVKLTIIAFEDDH